MEFYKLQASGNDFMLLDCRKDKMSAAGYKSIAKKCCLRKFAVGADGVLVLEACRDSDFYMRIFNADGSEAEMCGNGARCAALWYSLKAGAKHGPDDISFKTRAGVISARVFRGSSCRARVRIKMSDPFGINLDIPIHISGRKIRVNYVNTGVPHAVVFVDNLKGIDVDGIGRLVRFHKVFAPQGVNVDFVETENNNLVSIRTYERGVESETLSCGTGAAAAAVISAVKASLFCRNAAISLKVNPLSGETLKVYFRSEDGSIKDLWLEGTACLIYKGSI